jgi:hypothetical protein
MRKTEVQSGQKTRNKVTKAITQTFIEKNKPKTKEHENNYKKIYM